MAWSNIVNFIKRTSISYALYSATKPVKTPDAVVGKFEAPVAKAGQEFPVVFGTRDILDPNVVWYGDVGTLPLKKKGGKK